MRSSSCRTDETEIHGSSVSDELGMVGWWDGVGGGGGVFATVVVGLLEKIGAHIVRVSNTRWRGARHVHGTATDVGCRAYDTSQAKAI